MTESHTDGPLAGRREPPLAGIGFALGLAFGLGLFLAGGSVVLSLAAAALLGAAFAFGLLLVAG